MHVQGFLMMRAWCIARQGLTVNSLTGGGNGRTNVRVVVQCTSDAGKTVATKRSLKYMEGVLAGAWVLSSEWVHKSMHAGHWLPEAEA